MSRYLIVKSAEPEAYGAAYASSLEQLPGEEERLMDTPRGVLKVREIPEDDAERQVAELESDRRPHVLSVEPDHEAHAIAPEVMDEAEAAASALTAEQARALHGVDAAHTRGFRGKGAHVGVIDTGAAKEWIDRYAGQFRNLRNYTSDPSGYDTDSKHGTWVLSCIRGIAPEATYSAYKGLSTLSGSGTYSGLIRAIDDAVKDGCTDINGSFGGPKSDALNAAVNAAEDAGVRVTVAAGNEQRGRTDYTADNTSPASAEKCATTGAADSEKAAGAFSSWGNCVDWSAIGVAVRCPDHDLPGLGGYWNGTSMASPHACGCSALTQGFAKAEGRKALFSTCDDTGEPPHKEGFGFVRVDKALAKLEPPEPPYYPELPRIRKKDVSTTKIGELSEFVMTFNGEDHGRYARKGL